MLTRRPVLFLLKLVSHPSLAIKVKQVTGKSLHVTSRCLSLFIREVLGIPLILDRSTVLAGFSFWMMRDSRLGQ